MKIAQLAPLRASSLERECHDIERIAMYLTRQLVAEGHDVTLFDSNELRAATTGTSLQSHSVVRGIAEGHFDVVHAHDSNLDQRLLRELPVPVVTTLYRYPRASDMRCLSSVPLIAVSSDQRAYWRSANWAATVPCGVARQLADFSHRDEGYLVYAGPLSACGGVVQAIEIASCCALPLKILTAVRPHERRYLTDVVAPLAEASGASVTLLEKGDCGRTGLLSHAKALLHPVEWSDPCPLELLDSLGCGTPVIAWQTRSAAEIVEPGVCGFLVGNVAEAVDAVGRLPEVSRLACRRVFDERFSARVMARRCVDAYDRLRHDHAVAQVVASSQWIADRESSLRRC